MCESEIHKLPMKEEITIYSVQICKRGKEMGLITLGVAPVVEVNPVNTCVLFKLPAK